MEHEGSRVRYSQLSPLVLIMELKVFQSCLGLTFAHYALILPIWHGSEYNTHSCISEVCNLSFDSMDLQLRDCLLFQKRVWPFKMLKLKVWKLLSLD